MEAIHRARSFGGDATVLADYALTTTTTIAFEGIICDSAARKGVFGVGKSTKRDQNRSLRSLHWFLALVRVLDTTRIQERNVRSGK